jgi:elongation factor G
MKLFSTDAIVNVGVVGHGASGKTSLVSMLLQNAGAVNRLGKVSEGNTVTDFDEEEISRGISIRSALAYCDFNNKRINILDTPGYNIFIYDAKSALRVSDSALILVCAVNGVEIQTEKVWEFCREYEVPRGFVITKMDRDNADHTRALDSITKKFDRRAVLIQLPIGREKDFKGVVDLIKMKAYVYPEDLSGKAQTKDIPPEMMDEAKKYRAKLDEMVAESDEKLMEKFFESGTLDEKDLIEGLKIAIRKRNIFPIMISAATQNKGGHQILSTLTEIFPTAADAGPFTATKGDGKEEIQIKSDKNGAFSAFVFKSIADPYTGKITLFRVYSGSLKSDSSFYNVTRGIQEKIGGLLKMQGKESAPIEEAVAGEIAAVAKLKETQTGDTLSVKENPITYPPVIFPKPAIAFALEPKSRGDEEKISTALAKLREEDPILKIERTTQTQELLVSGMGQLHIEIIIAKLKKNYGVDVILHPPRVPYLETIKGTADVEGKYKKQSGGRGQFGYVKMKFEPLERGKDFEFSNDIFGGSVPRNYIPSVEKGIQEARIKGYLAGFPMIDFKASLYDGKYHPVDSSDLAFQIAASFAFKAGMEVAQPILLEPIMNVEIIAPTQFMGDLMGNLSGRRGRPQGSEQIGEMIAIKAQVPMAEMLTYQNDLNSITGGQGSFSMEFDHYEEVPAQIAEKVIATHKKKQVEEE